MLRALLHKIPGYGSVRFNQLGGSAGYWERRYKDGGNSGNGSYGESSTYKAQFLNSLVTSNGIHSVIEFGCGDGNQLTLANYPQYTGLDVSPQAIEICRRKFANDPSKQFGLAPGNGEKADLALSLDVLYHLIEEAVFDAYLSHLFGASKRFVVIYAYDKDFDPPDAHVRFRRFTPIVERRFPEFRLVQSIPAPAPQFAEFYVYQRS